MLLAWLSAAFLLGIIGGTAGPPAGTPSLVAAGLLAVAAWGLRRRRIWPAPLLLAALVLGIWRSPHQAAPTPHDLAYYNGSWVRALGVVDAEPDVRDTGANYQIAVDSVTIHRRVLAVTGRVQVHTPAAIALDYGDRVSLTGRLSAPANSASLPWRDILARQGIYSAMRFPRVSDLGQRASGLRAWLMRLRQLLEAGINAWLPEPEAALLIAIALGARSASLGNLAPALVTTGLIHLVAISGIKVALVAGIVHQVAGALAGRYTALLFSLASLWGYVLLTGTTVSGVRSAIMWTLVFIAAALGRGTVALVSLGFAAAAMVAVDPSLPWDTGFLLSTIGTFAIVAQTDGIRRLLRAIPTPWGEAFAVTVAAQVGTAPVVALSFHLLSFSGPLANAVVLPLLPFLLILGVLLGATAGLASVAGPLAALAFALVHTMILFVYWLAGWGLALPIVSLSPLLVLLYYLLLSGVQVVLLRRKHWAPMASWPHRGREFALASVLGCSALTVSLMSGASAPSTRFTWLGSGNAMLLQSRGMTALIDGSAQSFVLLERLGSLLPSDTHTIDAVIVTDPRARNVSALLSVLDHYRVSEVLDVGVEYPSSTYARWRAAVRSRGIPLFALRTAATLHVGAAVITALGPDALYPNPLDCVGLLRVSLPGRTFLLAGDASRREQLEALFRPVRLPAGTLLLAAPAQPAFVRAVGATRVFGTAAGAQPLPSDRVLQLAG